MKNKQNTVLPLANFSKANKKGKKTAAKDLD
jgi:hypothetical protein